MPTTVQFNLHDLPDDVKRDLEANAIIARQDPADLIASILNRRFEGILSFHPDSTPAGQGKAPPQLSEGSLSHLPLAASGPRQLQRKKTD